MRDFPRIGDYAFLSDCHTGALVAPDGSVEWLCIPRFDSPSIFGAILDRDAGHFRLGPKDRVPLARRYVPGTNVVETDWSVEGGWLTVTDALTLGPHYPEADGDDRPAATFTADECLVRVARCQRGEIDVELEIALAPDYGREKPQWKLLDDRRAVTVVEGRNLRLVCNVDLTLGEDGVLRGTRHMRQGERAFCALGWGAASALPASGAEAQGAVEATAGLWRDWLDEGTFPDHPWRIYLQRSALVLKGLTYAPTGALLAALTTSLPETPGGERNWDYRYSWIRDATWALWSLHVLGFSSEAIDFSRFLRAAYAASGRLQVMYGIGGEAQLDESTLDHLSGYEGAKPVRIGNDAYSQRQNDVFGALLDSIYIHTKAYDGIGDAGWTAVVQAVNGAIAVWREPDQGIWEARGEPRHYVSSKLMCWVALDRGARLARMRGEPDLAEKWDRIAEEIKDDILTRGVSERGVFRQHYDTDALDASTLLIPLMRFLPPDDERIRATVMAIAEELTELGLVLRYRTEETDDGLTGEEGTFLICSFWLVSALSEIGQNVLARHLCERLLSLAGPLDLYAEELEPYSGTHLGNFPQAFTHLALINAVSHVIAAETEHREPGEPTAVFTEMMEHVDTHDGSADYE